jgi:hypothetical protein
MMARINITWILEAQDRVKIWVFMDMVIILTVP